MTGAKLLQSTDIYTAIYANQLLALVSWKRNCHGESRHRLDMDLVLSGDERIHNVACDQGREHSTHVSASARCHV